MESAYFKDDLFDLPSDLSDDNDNDNDNDNNNRTRAFSLIPHPSLAFPDFVEEEELEWISNKDAFPMVESFVDSIPNNGRDLSPISMLENSTSSSSITSFSNLNSSKGSNAKGSDGAVSTMISLAGIFKVPGKARSKRFKTRRKEMSGETFQCWTKVVSKPKIGRKCLHCGSEKTPQWRAGPLGPKTLCNACGVRYKSGRLVPEYRPANSPTFSSEVHSNSHRKVVEMRKQKMLMCGEVEPEVIPEHFS